MSIFGVIVAGRMVQTNFSVLNDSEYIIELPDVIRINHIVVFLTGLQPLPEGLGASIFISWPMGQSFSSAEWNNLGVITNEKPSAIFRIGQLNKASQGQSIFDGAQIFRQSTDGAKNAFLGIMIEPLSKIQNKGELAEKVTPLEQSTFAEFAEKMLQNFVYYAQSFAVTIPNPNQIGEVTEYVPAKVVTEWFTNFRRKLQINPNFWRTLP